LQKQFPQYWLKLNDYKAYRVDQDRYRLIKSRAGLPADDDNFAGIITSTKQPIQGWVTNVGDQ
jgi:hypothetical protein